MMPSLIDTHCHLDAESLEQDLVAILQQAADVGVTDFIVPATVKSRWAKLNQLRIQYPNIHVAYGFHPMFMDQHQTDHINSLEAYLVENKAIAVGECGLDFYSAGCNEQQQKTLFQAQLNVAKNLQLPCIVHSRKSLDQVISMLRKHSVCGGVIHSFSGSLQQAKQLADLGFKLGIAATVCFDRAKKLQSVVTQMPMDSLLLESDAPDQSGPLHRGEINQPAFMLGQLNKMAELKQVSVAEIASKTSQNAKQLFAL